MCTAAVHGDPHAVGSGQERAGMGADQARRQRQHVLPEGDIDGGQQCRPENAVTWTSCPHACITGTSLPSASVARTVLA